MELDELMETRQVARRAHPALDVVDNVLYVTVQARIGSKQQFVVASSEGNLYSADEWFALCQERSIVSVSNALPKRCGGRWQGSGLKQTLQALRTGGVRDLPDWRQVYEEILRALDERLVLCDQRYLTLLTLFAMMTHFHPLFDFLPIVHVRGPSESGKSRMGHALAGIAFNGATLGCATDATLFRYAHEGRYTQIITEADHLATLGSGDRFVRQLQSACSKAEASVDAAETTQSKQFRPFTYFTFCPRVLLSTQPLRSQPLRSRCIRLDVIKSTSPDEEKLRRTVTDDTVWAPLRYQLYRLMLMRWRDMQAARDKIERQWTGASAPSGRSFDKWLPLAAVASLISDNTLSIVRELAAQDNIEHQRNATDRHEAHIALFALWLTRDAADHFLSRKELYERFMQMELPVPSNQDAIPLWARETDIPVTCESLRRSVPSQVALIAELRRLRLVGEAHHTRDGNKYVVKAATVRDVVSAIVGLDEVKRLQEEWEMESTASLGRTSPAA